MTQKHEYRPRILNETEVKRLMKQKHINFVDAFSRQIKELFIVKNPEYAGPKKAGGIRLKNLQIF